jgi:hypothetical protein
MSNIDITDLVLLVRAIDNQKGKHLKIALESLERADKLDAETRKIVLDGFNNFYRQILRLLDYSVEK